MNNENNYDDDEELPKDFSKLKSRIMYVEYKGEGLEGSASIGRVYFSKSGKTLYYNGMKFRSSKGQAFKANYYEVNSGDDYWISGPRKDEHNRLYGGNKGVIVDDDVRDEYKKLIG